MHSVAEIQQLLRSGRSSCVDLTHAYLARIERLDPKLHAFRALTPERALAEAAKADDALARGKPAGPLHGVPFAVKDHFDVAGVATTAGCSMLRDNIATRDAAAIRRLCDAGMILLGKLHTQQFGGGVSGINHDMGTPHNPWRREAFTPGGSSSGCGVAVAAGLVPVALGGDTGGSIRIPAALCGVVGFKTTLGQLGRSGVFPMSGTLDTIGPLTRRVEDAALVYSLLQGFDPDDESTLRAAEQDVLSTLDTGVEGLVIAYGQGCLRDGGSEEIIAAIDATRGLFADLGARVVDIDLPVFDKVRDMPLRYAISASELYAVLDQIPQVDLDRLDPVTSWVRIAEQLPVTDYLNTLALHKRLAREADAALKQVDVLITPTTLLAAQPIAAVDPKDGDGTEDYSQGPCEAFARNTSSGNMLGLCAITLPCGISADGLPIGLQVYARGFCEQRLLRVAQAYEQATDWHQRGPDLDGIG